MRAEAIPPGISGAIPRQVWVLGFVSLLMDVSSEIVQTLLPLYLVAGLGASAVTVGFVEGFSIAVAMVTRLYSGFLSDWFGNRKFLAALGYGLAAISKPLFPLADSLYWIVGAKFLDRVGKGIRSAPRDALIADITPAEIRGASFGLRKSLDTVGGFVGPIAAIALMLWTGGSFSTIFWIAVIPAFLAVGLLMACVKEPDVLAVRKQAAALRLKDAVRLNRSTWVVIFVSSILAIARFSEAFLLLRSQQVGFSIAWVPATIVIMHLVYGLAAYPVGMLSDRIGRSVMLGLSLLFLLAGDLVLAYTATIPLFILGIVLWGLHRGFSQGILATLIADTAPSHLRGTAFGVFSLTTGLLAFAGNLAAGVLWEQQGAQATFLMGALLSVAAIMALPLLRKYSAKPL